MKPLLRSALSLSIACAAALVACGGDDESPPSTKGDDDPTTSSGAGAAGGQGAGAGGGDTGGTAPGPQQKTISGDATWDVKFDAAAVAVGKTDCSYTRHYEGVEDATAPWVCPACEIVFRAAVTMTAGKAECFDQFSADPPQTEEWIGYGNGIWYRGFGLTSEQGMTQVSETGVSYTNMVPTVDVPDGGTMAFTVNGTFTFGQQPGDALAGFVPPDAYACGWPKADPAPYTGDYLSAKGATVPDGVFLDACNEPVRMHDFAGSYLLIDMAAMDCPPCQMMASEEEAFMANMKAQGVDVQIITLLAPSLSDPLGLTTKSMLDNWIGEYDLTSVVLADRAWGLAMFIPLYGDAVGYPSWVLVDKNLTVMDFGTGYGGFADIEAMLLADAGN